MDQEGWDQELRAAQFGLGGPALGQGSGPGDQSWAELSRVCGIRCRMAPGSAAGSWMLLSGMDLQHEPCMARSTQRWSMYI